MKKTVIITAVVAAIAPQALASETFGLCGGSDGGFYNALAGSIDTGIAKEAGRKKIQVQTEVLETYGSMENIDLYSSGDCALMIVQPDALNVSSFAGSYDYYQAHTEAAYWLANKEHGIGDLEDIEGKHKQWRIVIVDGSGSDVTMRSFVSEDKGYQGLYDSAIYADDTYDAASIVAQGKYNHNGTHVKVAGTLMITRPGAFSADIVSDFKGKLMVGELTDGDFNDAKAADGSKLYQNCEISKKHTQGLERASWGSQDTICMRAAVVVNRSWFEQFDRNEARALRSVVKKAVNRSLAGLE